MLEISGLTKENGNGLVMTNLEQTTAEVLGLLDAKKLKPEELRKLADIIISYSERPRR